ncbi:MAG: aspartate kinase [Euryarchaeota archaeon]|nr:aspartate kinase [Euryarchaeota archaeon]
MKVLKFGGSSLKDGISMKRVGSIISSDDDEIIIVISAIYGVTDSLIEFMSMPRQEQDVQWFIRNLRDRHVRMLADVASSMFVKQRAVNLLNEKLIRLERILYGIIYLEELTPRTKDLVQSFGERMSVIVLSAMLQDMGVNAVPVEADELGIITDGQFGSASVDMGVTRQNVQPRIREMISKQEVPVITGFFGKAPDGTITLFGRNGTDYSASVIASAVEADSLEIWKDVDGFMSADPKVVPGAVPIEILSYEEAAELSYFGAKVLHPRTVEPAKAQDIMIRVRNVFKPDYVGTSIGNSEKISDARTIKSISSMPDMAIVRAYGPGLGSRSGVLSEVSVLLSEAGINVYSAATSQTCISLLIEEVDLKFAKKVLARAQSTIVDRIETEKGVALLCVVGEGIGEMIGVAGSVFGTVAANGVNIGLISAGASLAALTFTVKREDLEHTTKTIHYELFGR